jgi:multidrug efflux pump subunit AcrA (membrane-fusion protein)
MSTILMRVADFRGHFGKQVFQLSVIAVLAAMGLWGHKNHWQLSAAHADTSFGHASRNRSALATATTEAAVATSPAGRESPSIRPMPEMGALAPIKFPTSNSIGELGITIEQASHRPLARQISATGTVVYDPSRHAQLSVRASGTVWRIEKHMGESVHAGDVLAIIDSPALGQAKADFLHSIADVQLRQKVYEPLQSLAKGEISIKQIHAAETDLRKARVELFNAHQALVSIGLPIDLDDCQKLPEAELEKRVKFLGLPESLVSRFDPEAVSASLLPIHAPFEGLVINRDLTIGEVVSSGQPYFEIADVTRMWILLNVREQDSHDLQIGQQVSFSAGSSTGNGTISWISTAVDPKTRTVEVRCEVENPEVKNDSGVSTGKRVLRANLFGVGQIEVSSNPSALTVPTKAVQWNGEGHVVFVQVDAQSFVPRRVRLGIVTDEFTEVVDQLTANDPVAVDGSHILKAELSRSAMTSPP